MAGLGDVASDAAIGSIFDEQDFQLLPSLHRLLKTLSSTASTKEAADAATGLKQKIQRARDTVNGLPAVDVSLDEQQELYEARHAELARKREIIEQYKTLRILNGGARDGAG